MAMNWRLSQSDYTIRGALVWGNCLKHARASRTSQGKEKIIHITLAALEALPLLGQLIALVEYAAQKYFAKTSAVEKKPPMPKPAPIPTENEIEKEQTTWLAEKRPVHITFSKKGLKPLPDGLQDLLFLAQRITDAVDVVQEIYQPLLTEVEADFKAAIKEKKTLDLCGLKTIPEAIYKDKILTHFECGLSLELARFPAKDPTAAVSSKTFYKNDLFKQHIKNANKSPSTNKPLSEKEVAVCPKALAIVNKQLRFHSSILNGLLEHKYIQLQSPPSFKVKIKKAVQNILSKLSSRFS